MDNIEKENPVDSKQEKVEEKPGTAEKITEQNLAEKFEEIGSHSDVEHSNQSSNKTGQACRESSIDSKHEETEEKEKASKKITEWVLEKCTKTKPLYRPFNIQKPDYHFAEDEATSSTGIPSRAYDCYCGKRFYSEHILRLHQACIHKDFTRHPNPAQEIEYNVYDEHNYSKSPK